MLSSLLALALTTAALAGNGNVVGNGGNSVVCPDSRTKSEIYFHGRAILDLAEGKQFRSYHYKTLASLRPAPLGVAFPKAVSQFLSRALFPRFELSRYFAAMGANTTWVPQLPQVYTLSPELQARGCTLEQAAIQRGAENPSPFDPLNLEISTSVWSTLATDQKVALLFHEYLLKDRLFQQGPCATDDIRELVAYVLSDEALVASDSDWNFETSRSCEKRWAR